MKSLEIVRTYDLHPDGVRITVDWDAMEVGSSVFIPCIDTTKAKKQLESVLNTKKWSYILDIRVENRLWGCEHGELCDRICSTVQQSVVLLRIPPFTGGFLIILSSFSTLYTSWKILSEEAFYQNLPLIFCFCFFHKLHLSGYVATKFRRQTNSVINVGFGIVKRLSGSF